MIACLDVDYRTPGAVAACVLLEAWNSSAPARELTVKIDEVADYAPGEFYRRELPCLLAVLQEVSEPLAAIVIDGYVWLDATQRPGLGAKLYEALNVKTPVIGVAKTAFAGSSFATPVMRGASTRPLWITAAGIDVHQAAENVRGMFGAHRLPDMLKRVDRLCREASDD
jgi:deoxyribonuclease V